MCLTDGALALLSSLDPHRARWLEVAVLVAASVIATAVRYLALRSWVFAYAQHPAATAAL